MKVLHVRVPRLLVCVLLGALVLYVVHVVAFLVGRYGSLFYIETYLPSPPLPPQRRELQDLQVPPGRQPHSLLSGSHSNSHPYSPSVFSSHPRDLKPSQDEFVSSSAGKFSKAQETKDFQLHDKTSGAKPPDEALRKHFVERSDDKTEAETGQKSSESSGGNFPLETGSQSTHGTATKFANRTLRHGQGRGPLTRMLCLIVTSPQFHDARAVHVKNTWASHCDRAVFLSSEAGPQLGEVVVVPQAAEYDQLWQKVVTGFEWSTEHEQEYEWLVKVDDDSFLLVENLRFMLKDYEPDLLYATGLFLKDWDTEETYLNGGAGYAVSRAGVRAVASAAQPGGRCTQEGGMTVTDAEDLNMAACFRALGVKLLDSRDDAGHQRFNVYPPQNVIDPRRDTDWIHLWLKKIAVFPYKFGFAEMSSDVISFHYVDAESMYLLYYLLYVVNPRVGSPDHEASWEEDAQTHTHHDKIKFFNHRKRRSSMSDFNQLTQQQNIAPESQKTKHFSSSTFENVKNNKKYYGVVQSRKNFSFRDLHQKINKNSDAAYPKPDIEEIGPRDYVGQTVTSEEKQ